MASAASSTVPEMALTQNAPQMIGKNRSKGATGSFGANPSTRSPTIALMPTTVAIPATCMNKMPG